MGIMSSKQPDKQSFSNESQKERKVQAQTCSHNPKVIR